MLRPSATETISQHGRARRGCPRWRCGCTLLVTTTTCLAWSLQTPSAKAETTSSQAASAAASQVESDPEGALGLLSDVERIVDAEEYDQWFTDRDAYQDILPILLQSVCRATPAARQEALRVARARAHSSEDARTLFEKAGEVTDEVEAALRREREYEALRRAVKQAPAECPFWSPPEPEFLGRQTTRKRFAIGIETGGMGMLAFSGRQASIGGGGGVRFLPSYRINDSFTFLGGVHYSAGGLTRLDAASSEVTVNYFVAMPLLVRYHDVAWHYELEAGYAQRRQTSNPVPSHGFRIGAGIGYSTLRLRTIIPWVGVIAATEHFFPGGGRPSMQLIRLGARGGFFWDP
jgi:hypothetical protein